MNQPPRSRLFIGILFLGFIATGACTVLLGPLLPLLASKWHISDQAAGSLFTAQFLGSMFGTLISGRLVRSLGFGKTLSGGYALMAVYVFGVWMAPWPWLVILTAVNGIGLGLVIPSTNMVVSDHFAQRRASALNLINLSWSIGAIICPVALAFAKRADHLQGALNLLGALTAVSAATVVTDRSVRIVAATRSRLEFRSVPFGVLAALFFLYIGTEGAVAGWLATYAKRALASSTLLWMSAPSFFWGAMMAGRACAPLILRRTGERTLVIAGLVISFSGVAGILIGGSSAVLLISAAVCGLGMCTVFPIFIAMVSHYFEDAATHVSAYMFASAALGGAVLPWAVGAVSSKTGELQLGLFVPLIGVVLQFILVFTLRDGRAARETSG